MEQKQTFVLKGINGNDDLSKQYFTILENKGFPPTLIIRKMALSNDVPLYLNCGFKIIRKYKDKYLFQQDFSIRLETLNKAMDIINGK